MVEKIIKLENIPLTDFLGIENRNIKALVNAFPKCKIVSRGDEIRIQGSGTDILQVNDVINLMLRHYESFGKVTDADVERYVQEEQNMVIENVQKDVLVYGNKGLQVKAKTPKQRELVEEARNNDLVFALGPAGTGKTYISVALAVRALKNKQVKKIIITRPAVEAGENLGFLPGDLKEKIDPYLRPIYDALDDMVPPEKLRYYQENRIIEIAPLAYMRGRTLHDAFILLDEAQNTTPMQIKMFLTRMGPNSKVIITGDRSQIDLPKHQKSGLEESINILKPVKGIGFVELGSGDVIRHRIVKDIIDAYDRYDEQKEAMRKKRQEEKER